MEVLIFHEPVLTFHSNKFFLAVVYPAAPSSIIEEIGYPIEEVSLDLLLFW